MKLKTNKDGSYSIYGISAMELVEAFEKAKELKANIEHMFEYQGESMNETTRNLMEAMSEHALLHTLQTITK